MYEAIVGLVTAAHFAFLAYLLTGGFVALRWPRTIWLHALAVLWGIGSATAHWDCPLTWLERWGRAKAGMGPLRSDGFIAHYITGVLYPADWVGAVQLGLFATVAASWTLVGWQSRRPGRHVLSRV
jgi:hypothetical protein